MNGLLNAFGMAYSSGKIAIGEKLIEQIKSNKVLLVVVFADIGPTTLKKIEDKCAFYKINLIKCELLVEDVKKQFAGKKVSAIGFNDQNITKLIQKNIINN